MATKIKTHRFIVEVTTTESRNGAYYAVLAAFAKRKPDVCEFSLKKKAPPRASRPHEDNGSRGTDMGEAPL